MWKLYKGNILFDMENNKSTVAIITYSSAFNYGAMLQTYGLYKVIERMGYNSYVIDYIPSRYNIESDEYIKKGMSASRIWKHLLFLSPIWKIRYIGPLKKKAKVFRGFLERNVALSKKYYSDDQLKKMKPKADVYVTGSDQVWNSTWTDDEIDYPYYLSFLDDVDYRIAYAASFGNDKIGKSESNLVKHYLNKYKAISVRELSGKKILNDIGIDSKVVADPTVIAGKTVFDELISSERICEESYILLFYIHDYQEIKDVIVRIKKKSGKKIIIIKPYQDSSLLHDCECNVKCLPKVEDWIRYIRDAEYIATDSFHCTVFSTMYHKNFSVNGNVENSGRIRDYLNIIGLTSRVFESRKQLISQMNNEIDYENIDNKICNYVKESMIWLSDSLKIQE